MPYYGELLGTCSINYLDQLVTAGETRQLLESFNEDAFIKFTDEQQTAFAGTVLPVYEQQAKELADAKDYDGAIALIDTLWQVLPEKAPSDGLSESAGTCFCAKAKALYNKKSYEDAAAVCKQGVGYHIDLPTEADRELAGIYTDASLAQADKLLKAKKYKDAYDYLQGVQLSAMTADQRTKVQDKRDAVLKAAKPKNGAVLERNVGSGYNQFTIEAGSRDALVKIESTKDPAKYVLFYVHANKSATVKVSQGSYTVKYVTGDNYIDKEHTFMSGASYAKADRVYDLKVTYSGNYVNYDVVTITLYTVLFGNLETSTISPSEF